MSKKQQTTGESIWWWERIKAKAAEFGFEVRTVNDHFHLAEAEDTAFYVGQNLEEVDAWLDGYKRGVEMSQNTTEADHEL